MKKKLALMLATLMALIAMAGCSTDSPGSASSSSETEREKISILVRGSETSEKYRATKAISDAFIEGKDLDVEYELINADADYVTKLQLYMNSNTLPDVFGCPNGPLSKAARDMNALVDVGAELKRINQYDNMNVAVLDFLKDAEDGNVYLFPEALYCEYFMYRKDKFQEYGLEVPKDWDEFKSVCETLKSKGEIPLLVGGQENWLLLRYLSFPPWRVSQDEFIMDYNRNEAKFADSEVAKYGVNLLYDMGQAGYFQPGFASTDYTAASDLFFGGTGCIMYANSGMIKNSHELYANGQLGFFPVPDMPGQENMKTNVPVHGGFGTAFNAQTYDDTMKVFFEFMCENYGDACYEEGEVFSPFKGEPPAGLDPIFYELYPMFENAEASWVSWDDKLDSAVLTQMVDAVQQLAQGTITPDDFIGQADTSVK